MGGSIKFDNWLDSSGKKRGAVLQVVSVFDNAHYIFNTGSANQTTFYDISGLKVDIYPTSLTSRFLIMGNINGGQQSNNYNGFFRITRNGTAIGSSEARGMHNPNGTAMSGWRAVDNVDACHCDLLYVDNPYTTSKVTYTVQICNSGGSAPYTTVNRPYSTDTTWVQASSSSLVVMEIQS
jgi:hypothetical protein